MPDGLICMSEHIVRHAVLTDSVDSVSLRTLNKETVFPATAILTSYSRITFWNQILWVGGGM